MPRFVISLSPISHQVHRTSPGHTRDYEVFSIQLRQQDLSLASCGGVFLRYAYAGGLPFAQMPQHRQDGHK